MKAIANELEKMDKYFSTKKESEKWLMILGVAGIITFLAYTYLLPYAEGIYKSSEAKRNQLTKSIIEQKSYLDSITINGDRNYYIKKYDRDIKNKNGQIVLLNKKIAYINSNLDKLSNMLFNQKSWSNFLNSITENAKQNNIDIQFIKNRYVDNKGNFGHVLEIEVGGSGSFKDMVKFLNVLEQNTLVTDIYSSHFMGSSDGINADINISVWGINH
jgi:lipopolysaccharide export LptBFGC system permease protein LptF